MGISWGSFGASWGVVRPRARKIRSGFPSGHSLGAVLGASWAVLEASCAVLGLSGVVLGPSWRSLGLSWAHLGGLLGRLGASGSRQSDDAEILQKPIENQRCFALEAFLGVLLEASDGVLEASWAVWSLLWRLGPIVRRFGALLDRPRGLSGRSLRIWGLFGAPGHPRGRRRI